MSIEPIPLSEREKQTQKILDFAQDMYDDEDYHKYIWAVAKSSDGGKTFIITAGRLPVGMSLTCKPDAEIAPISMAQSTVIEPTTYTIKAVSASEFLPEHHPVTLLKMQHEAAPSDAWEAPPGQDKEYVLTFDLGEERIIGCIEFWPTQPGKYHAHIGASNDPANFAMMDTPKFENFGPATVLPLAHLTKARYVQINTNCNAVKQVRILSMSENATAEEKAQLSREFYEGQTKGRRKS